MAGFKAFAQAAKGAAQWILAWALSGWRHQAFLFERHAAPQLH